MSPESCLTRSDVEPTRPTTELTCVSRSSPDSALSTHSLPRLRDLREDTFEGFYTSVVEAGDRNIFFIFSISSI